MEREVSLKIIGRLVMVQVEYLDRWAAMQVHTYIYLHHIYVNGVMNK